MIHVDTCPECGDVAHQHFLDPPNHCTHEYERYEPVAYVPLHEVKELIAAHADAASMMRLSAALKDEYPDPT